MSKAIIGKKLGMSQVFAENGDMIPVTVIEAGPCPVVRVKTKEKDNYEAVQVAFLPCKKVKKPNGGLNKPDMGQFKKAGIAVPYKVLRELPLDVAEYGVGKTVNCGLFIAGDKVDVSGVSKGHGFAGTIKRWNGHRGPMAHGSGYHRGVGSLSAHTDPSRVFKNKKMPGHYGCDNVTVQNLTVVRVDAERNLLLVKGGIPGAKGSIVVITDTVKA